ncbi:ChbG/HpnK family deacetylase [Dyella koreensis]|uniref:ChbG/HpnK family deacetylase n=1 Tax=Dyella koreensis TaxID=311235 RepID=A0ABW8K8T9_9GAMM
MKKRGLVLTADDFGIAPGVSRAICELLELGHLSATGCMVVSPHFPTTAPWLRPYLDRADIGLHVTLTHDRSLPSLMRDAFLHRLDPLTIRSAIETQVQRFEQALGRPPAYLDGHHHVHQLPLVSEVVVDVATRLGAYVRVTDEALKTIGQVGVACGKAALLSALARPFAREVHARGLQRNHGFRGARPASTRRPFRDLFRRMIRQAPAGTILMCHPGHIDAALRAADTLVDSREEEFRYLASTALSDDLTTEGLSLARLVDALSEGGPTGHGRS